MNLITVALLLIGLKLFNLLNISWGIIALVLLSPLIIFVTVFTLATVLTLIKMYIYHVKGE